MRLVVITTNGNVKASLSSLSQYPYFLLGTQNPKGFIQHFFEFFARNLFSKEIGMDKFVIRNVKCISIPVCGHRCRITVHPFQKSLRCTRACSRSQNDSIWRPTSFLQFVLNSDFSRSRIARGHLQPIPRNTELVQKMVLTDECGTAACAQIAGA